LLLWLLGFLIGLLFVLLLLGVGLRSFALVVFVVCLWFVAGCFVGLVPAKKATKEEDQIAKNILAAKVNEARKLDGEKKPVSLNSYCSFYKINKDPTVKKISTFVFFKPD
jgi:Na+-transporting NADH:ubiquinone oxidoreductase subunit NqrC